MDKNIHGEVLAIRWYRTFYSHLIARGRMSEARKINEILNEEMVHYKELMQIKKMWKLMK